MPRFLRMYDQEAVFGGPLWNTIWVPHLLCLSFVDDILVLTISYCLRSELLNDVV